MSTRDWRSSASCRTNDCASARERLSTERAEGMPSDATRRRRARSWRDLRGRTDPEVAPETALMRHSEL
eukprot:scaffold110056_cov105-Phaeocystis_antarctica.AAC.3